MPRRDQYDAIMTTLARLHALGKPLAGLSGIDVGDFFFRDARAVSSSTYLLSRWVRDQNDQKPTLDTSGRDWFERVWPLLGKGADCYQFSNEWFSDGWNEAETRAFAHFYVELAETARLEAGVKATLGDLSVGTPQPWQIPWLKEMLDYGEATGCPLNYHAYSAQDQDPNVQPPNIGETDMLPGAESYDMRWLMDTKDHPRLKVVFGECGNAGKNLFRPETPALIRQFHTMLLPYNQVVSANWWTISDAKAGIWPGDDFTPALSQIVDWLASV